MPDETSDAHLYVGDAIHGRAVCDLPLTEGPREFLSTLAKVARNNPAFDGLSANTKGFWPLILVACKHYRLPIPPAFWIEAIYPNNEAAAD